jgi:hypothetical protein
LPASDVLRLKSVSWLDVGVLVGRYGLELRRVPDGAPVPASFWGDSEAGLKGSEILARSDTPVHSVLHEACHCVCATPERRTGLERDAGGDYDEENAVCYLQILLADFVPRFGRARMLADMDAWGYTFRLGSARAWFQEDARDAHLWLVAHELVTDDDQPTWKLRETA